MRELRGSHSRRYGGSSCYCSAPLLLVLALYIGFKGTPHFFLHTLMGWDVALVLLLVARYFGRPWSRWDGLLLLGLALYALTPDFIYSINPFHRDWMDVSLQRASLLLTFPT